MKTLATIEKRRGLVRALYGVVLLVLWGLGTLNQDRLWARNENPGIWFGLNFGQTRHQGAFSGELDNGIHYGLDLYSFPDYGWVRRSFLGFFWQTQVGLSQSNLSFSNQSSLSGYGLNFGPGLSLAWTPYFQPYGAVRGGIEYLNFDFVRLNETSNSVKPKIVAEVGLMTQLGDFGLAASAAYHRYPVSGGNGEELRLGGSVLFSGELFSKRNRLEKNESPVRITEVALGDIFAARYGTYIHDGIGTATVLNNSGRIIRNISIETALPILGEDATPSESVILLRPGGSAKIDLKLLLSDEALRQNSGKVTVRLKVSFEDDGSGRHYIESSELYLHNKNVITWNRTEHIGSFINPEDEDAARLVRKTTGVIAKESYQAMPEPVVTAASVYELIRSMGLSYAADANTGFKSLGKNALDTVSYPAETLERGGGDCDDLTVLMATLLESVGIKTAVVTTPGHISMMFSTGITENNSAALAGKAQDYFVYQGLYWVPVEVTLLKKNFRAAWLEGLRDLKKFKGRPELGITESSVAWQKYPPVVPNLDPDYQAPQFDRLQSRLTTELGSLQAELIGKDEARYATALAKKPKDYRLANRAGIFFARKGDLKTALKYFRQAITGKKSYAPAHCNIGNVYLLQSEHTAAAKAFSTALKYKPKDHKYRLNLARALFEAGDKAKARAEYRRAVAAYPAYRQSYAYLDGGGGTRAEESGLRRRRSLWDI